MTWCTHCKGLGYTTEVMPGGGAFALFGCDKCGTGEIPAAVRAAVLSAATERDRGDGHALLQDLERVMRPSRLLGLERLAARPRLYARGDDLPVGCYTVERMRMQDGRPCFVVVRTVGSERWLQLTARSDPAWRTWPTREACCASVMVGDLFDCADWPHWGRP